MGEHHGDGEQVNTSQAGGLSDTVTVGSAHRLSGGLAVPSGSFQFQADWKRLKSHPEEFYTYFKVISTVVIAITCVPGVLSKQVLYSVCVCVCMSVHLSVTPFSSNRQHLSYDDCLEVRGKIIRTVLCCIVY